MILGKTVSRYFVILFSAILFTCSGDEEVATRSYPSLDTKEVTGVDATGAILNADILNVGFSGISDHGFVYDDAPNPTIEKSDRISLGERSAKGTFSTLANRNLVKDKKYYVRAYAISKSDDIVVYGQQIDFISQGGSEPEIKDFMPKEGIPGDTIVLVGSGFSNINSNNQIFIGATNAPVIKSSNDSVVFVLTNATNPGEQTLKLKVGQYSVSSTTSFNLKEFQIVSVFPDHLTFGDTVTITVENLPSNLEMFTGNILGKPIKIHSFIDQKIRAIIPVDVAVSSQEVIINLGSQVRHSLELLVLNPPLVSNVSPLEAKTGSTVKLSGDYFNPIKEYNKVQVGDFICEITSVKRDEVVFKLPSQSLRDQFVPIQLSVSGQTIVLPEPFHIISPWKKIANYPDGETYAGASFSLNGIGYVGIGIGGNESGGFWGYDPNLNAWQEIRPFISNDPIGLFATSSFVIDNEGYVGTGLGNAGGYNENFLKYSPSTNEWIRIADFPSLYIVDAVGWTINNRGFITLGSRGYRNATEAGTWEYLKATDNWVRRADFPGYKPIRSGHSGFSYGNKGYVLVGYGKEFWEYDANIDQWTQLPDFPGNTINKPTSFVINGVAYVVGGSTNLYNGFGGDDYNNSIREVWSYDIQNKVWKQLEDFPGYKRVWPSSFVIGQKGYYGVGLGYENNGSISDFWEFDPSKL